MVDPILIELKVFDAKILEYGIPSTETAGAAGYDLKACLFASVYVNPGQTVKIGVGVGVHVKDRNIAACIFPRSGLAANYQLTLQNAVGLIDSDFQGELQVLLRNEGLEVYKVNPGDRIAQLVFMPVIHPMMTIVQHFTGGSARAEEGFGSTGVQSRSLSEPVGPIVESLSGRELPTQSLGNDELLVPGTLLPNVVTYEPTGHELLEAEYGDE